MGEIYKILYIRGKGNSNLEERGLSCTIITQVIFEKEDVDSVRGLNS